MNIVGLGFLFDILAFFSAGMAVSVSVFSAYISNRSVRKLKKLARRNNKIKDILISSAADAHVDDEEMEKIVQAYLETIEVDNEIYQISTLINKKSRRMLADARYKKNENFFIELAHGAEANNSTTV